MKLSIVFVLSFFGILSYGCASYTYVTYKNQERNAFLQQTDSSPFQMYDASGMYFFAYVSEMHYYEEHYYVAGIVLDVGAILKPRIEINWEKELKR